MSYDARLGNLNGLKEYYANVAAYKPNENELKLTGLDALAAESQAANDAVSAGFMPLLTAWNLRDAKLYTDDDSVLETFRGAKEYYKSLYAPGSSQYKAVTARAVTLDSNSRR